MSNIVSAKVSIRGSRKLFWHKFGRDALPLEKQERTGVAGHDPEEWRRTVLVDKTGQLYLEPSYVFAAMREAGKYHKINRRNASTFIQATLQVTDNRVYIDRYFPGYPNGQSFDVTNIEPPPEDDDEPLYLDVRGVRNPSTRARNIRYRIASTPGWTATFGLLWDKTVISKPLMESIAIDAGRLVGLGNGRAIGMGRFEVEAFEIE
jgi:hypothetical protein